MFRALYLEQNADKTTTGSLRTLDDSALPAFDSNGVTVDVQYSTLNFKDGLAISGKSPVVRKWPMVPGIDFAGTVSASDDPRWQVGDAVILNGWGVGESHWGGLAEKARVHGDWLVRLPAALQAADAMALGTAGYTAMLCVLALERQGVKPGSGDILVTGATGGVGSVAVSLLSRLGHRVVASTGKADEAEYLRALGAADVLDDEGLAQLLGQGLRHHAGHHVAGAPGREGADDLDRPGWPGLLRQRQARLGGQHQGRAGGPDRMRRFTVVSGG